MKKIKKDAFSVFPRSIFKGVWSIRFLLILTLFFFPFFIPSPSGAPGGALFASHLMGGEITWECQGNGQYIFKLKFYRDCNGINTPTVVSLSVFNHPIVSSITLTLLSQTDISPVCNGAGPSISCTNAEGQPGWPTSSSPVAGAVQESVFQSAPITLNGIPSPQGWIFAYSDCCRNGSLTNLQNASSYGFTLRAVMYPFNGQNANLCFDSSPTFLESPSTVICLGSPFKYNHNAYDPDLDSLSFKWAEPLDDFTGVYALGTNPAPIPFTTGYTYDSPLPGTAQNPANVPALINPSNGEISFTSNTQGYFVTNVKVEAWKCGTLVAEIYREIQVVLLPCAVNSTPVVTYTSYQTTVPAGTLVNFTLNGSDPGVLADGVTPQTVTINASGTQFGTNFTNASSGCLNPPCATLSAPLPVSAPNTMSTVFNWQTTCNHISYNASCNTVSNTYTFVFRVRDDFCPAPAENISTVAITVLATPIAASPQPNCVSVLSNGDVTLTWSIPADPDGTFNGYLIYSSNALGGPYTLLDSVLTFSQTSYTHIGANATTAPVYYYIQTRSGCFGLVQTAAVDTVSSMYLNVTNPGNGTASLFWNAVASPNAPTSSGIYSIYEEYPTGIWTLTGSTTNVNFIDSIFVCNGTINYRIEMADNSGCTSVSSIDGGTFQNIIVPDVPRIDTLSVDDSNNALMNWNVNPSADAAAYVIYIFNGTAWIPIDTVPGINNTNYNYLLSNAGLGSEQYRLAAYDSCGNISPLGIVYSTMYLTSIPEICDRSVVLNWTAYSTLGTGLATYRIYQSMVGLTGPYTEIATVPVGTLTYTVPALAPLTTYYYKIEAVDSSGTKTVSSNRIAFYSATPLPPQFSYLRKVSVLDPNQVDVTCHIDVSAATLNYKIMRSYDTIAANYVLIGSVPSSAVSPIVYNDTKVLTDNYSYYYKIINVDSCGYDGLQTNIGRTILLSALSNSLTMENTLSWNDYEGWSGNVVSYNIYRGIDGVMDPTPIMNLPFSGSGANSYTDDVSALLSGEGVFNYYVEAVEGMGNIYSFNEFSLSNIAEAYQDPRVFIPNAFRPEGALNTVFIPVTTYVDFTEYEFSVFNRWGLQVFSTKDVNLGWDGNHGTKKCELGVYVYLVRFKSSKGEYIDFKGSVTLLR
ncbi:MAG: gliding motility-associated C-terminal domain-containing protein [Bacteroidota bacterium]